MLACLWKTIYILVSYPQYIVVFVTHFISSICVIPSRILTPTSLASSGMWTSPERLPFRSGILTIHDPLPVSPLSSSPAMVLFVIFCIDSRRSIPSAWIFSLWLSLVLLLVPLYFFFVAFGSIGCFF